jgi:hypothetical protein
MTWLDPSASLRTSPGGSDAAKWLKMFYFCARPMTIFVDRFSSFAYNSQSKTEERLRRGNPERSATLWTVAYRMGPSFRGLWWAKALGKTEL